MTPEELDIQEQTPSEEVTAPSATEEVEVTPMPVEDATDRLAAEFITLTGEFPEFQTPGQLPEEVLDTAAAENIPLLDAWLRYRWQEEKRVLAAAKKRQEAAGQSAGSLSRGAVGDDPGPDAFLRAFRSAL